MAKPTQNKSRFDARISEEQKAYFEKAATLGRYRNLTDFVLLAAFEKAKEIIAEKEQILASERDGRIFFKAITQTAKPSRTLRKAVTDYNSLALRCFLWV